MKWKLFSAPSVRQGAAPAASVLDAECEVIPRRGKGLQLFGQRITPKGLLMAAVTAIYLTVGTYMVFSYTAPVEVQAAEPEGIRVVMAAEEAVPEPTPAPQDDELLLAMGIDAVISSVPGGESCTDTTLIMIGNVIVNRTQDARYPGTIMEVLTQPMQFSCYAESGVKWVGVSSYHSDFKERCVSAARKVIAGERVFDNSVVYVSGSRQGTVIAQLDGLYFGR